MQADCLNQSSNSSQLVFGTNMWPEENSLEEDEILLGERFQPQERAADGDMRRSM